MLTGLVAVGIAGVVLLTSSPAWAGDAVSEGIDPAHTGVAAEALAPPLTVRWTRTFDPTAGATLDGWDERNAICGQIDAPCEDAFAARYDDANRVMALTHFGGRARDVARALATGRDGSVFVVGHTMSEDFPGASAAAEACRRRVPVLLERRARGRWVRARRAVTRPDGRFILRLPATRAALRVRVAAIRRAAGGRVIRCAAARSAVPRP